METLHLALRRNFRTPDARVLPVFHRFDPEGSTDVVDFYTIKHVHESREDKCPVNYVVLDGQGGNTWEQLLALMLEANPDVDAYVKNDHLEFAIPYQHAGRSHRYYPDFIVRLKQRPDEPDCYLIIEVSGGLKSPGSTQVKRQTAKLWCKAVNTHNGYGRWGYVEMTEPTNFRDDLVTAIRGVYGDGVLTGSTDWALPSEFTPADNELFADFFTSTASEPR